MEANVQSQLALIGKWRFPADKFSIEKIVTFKQTNVMGNTYFSNYIEWQGEAREKLFLCHPAASAFLQKFPHIFLITHSLSHRFVAHSFFGDSLRIDVTARNILDYSLMMVFKYWNNRGAVLIGEGWQKVCFWDKLLNRPCKIPQIFLDLALSIAEK